MREGGRDGGRREGGRTHSPSQHQPIDNQVLVGWFVEEGSGDYQEGVEPVKKGSARHSQWFHILCNPTSITVGVVDCSPPRPLPKCPRRFTYKLMFMYLYGMNNLYMQ